jgi:AcrR family transcriptional regulator
MRVRTEAKRRSIIETARPLFLEGGYAGVTMAAVASALGGSKGTLYGYFPSKEELFGAVVAEASPGLFALLETVETEADDLVSGLEALGCAYLRLVLSQPVIETSRMVVAEVGRQPEIGEIFFSNGPARTLRRVQEILSDLGKRHDLATLSDPEAGAHFTGICDGGLYSRVIWGAEPVPTDQEITQRVRCAVRRFLAGYAP